MAWVGERRLKVPPHRTLRTCNTHHETPPHFTLPLQASVRLELEPEVSRLRIALEEERSVRKKLADDSGGAVQALERECEALRGRAAEVQALHARAVQEREAAVQEATLLRCRVEEMAGRLSDQEVRHSLDGVGWCGYVLWNRVRVTVVYQH